MTNMNMPPNVPYLPGYVAPGNHEDVVHTYVAPNTTFGVPSTVSPTAYRGAAEVASPYSTQQSSPNVAPSSPTTWAQAKDNAATRFLSAQRMLDGVTDSHQASAGVYPGSAASSPNRDVAFSGSDEDRRLAELARVTARRNAVASKIGRAISGAGAGDFPSVVITPDFEKAMKQRDATYGKLFDDLKKGDSGAWE